ncbi:MAG: GNAT family protein [bacterium]
MKNSVTTDQNGVVFLRGFKTILRPPNRVLDHDLFYRWINDPDIWCFLKRFAPISHQSEGEWIDKMNTQNNSQIFTIETHEGQPIGVMGLEKIDWKNRHAMTGSFIGEKCFWGQGYGTDAKMALLKYAFDELNLHKVMSGVISFNKRSLAYSKKCGYVEQGCLKDHVFRDGKYHDETLLAVFRSSWHVAYSAYLNKMNSKK